MGRGARELELSSSLALSGISFRALPAPDGGDYVLGLSSNVSQNPDLLRRDQDSPGPLEGCPGFGVHFYPLHPYIAPS